MTASGARNPFTRRNSATARACVLASCVTMTFMATTATAVAPTATPSLRSSYVVTVATPADLSAVLRSTHIAPDFVYSHALVGFAAQLPPSLAHVLASDPLVTGIVKDAEGRVRSRLSNDFSSPAQAVPSGVRYVRADHSPTARIDGRDDPMDVDVAILDSGIDAGHPDLNVAGGFSCVQKRSALKDALGHGTAVAGIVGARDNGFGVVGVAPGARLWSVRVLDDRGAGKLSQVLCGLDWVMANASRMEVANMSIEFDTQSLEDGCGVQSHGPSAARTIDPMHLAVCALTAAGKTIVAAAGNHYTDARLSLPGAYRQVITTSAIADFNGHFGGAPSAPSCRDGVQQTDDTFAGFSNFGPRVDIAAPGVCIATTAPAGKYAYASGTSFATPHVTGAVALLLSKHAGMYPSDVQAALIAASTHQRYPGDPDGIFEPTLDTTAL